MWLTLVGCRRDICHEHHKLCLCKIVLTVGKISYNEQFSSAISKIFVSELVKLTLLCIKVEILKERWGFLQISWHFEAESMS